jgi:serine/threonine-protein kinase
MAILQEGQVINNNCTVERFLGEGAFAEVYRVKHRFLGRQALKVFKLPGYTVKEIQNQLDEAVILSQIAHPNIVRVYDANVLELPDGLFGYFTMEYVAGGSLDNFWGAYKVEMVPVETTVDIIKQTCLGVSVAHSTNPPIIHRDVKPQNILIGYDGNGLRVRVSDFGLAKAANPLTLLVSAMDKGTLGFKAPETFKDNIGSCAGDVWAIGCTLYLLLTDILPFAELDVFGKMQFGKFDRPLIPPSELNIYVDQSLDNILSRALALEYKNRYQNAREMLIDIEKWKPKPQKSKLKALPTSAESMKNALGPLSSVDQEKALNMVNQAKVLAKSPEKLSEAADILEQALNKWPQFREQYDYKLRLWRKGMSG